jgi:hypothetical protein
VSLLDVRGPAAKAGWNRVQDSVQPVQIGDAAQGDRRHPRPGWIGWLIWRWLPRITAPTFTTSAAVHNPTRHFLPLKPMGELLAEPCERRRAARPFASASFCWVVETAVLTANTNKPVKHPCCWF